MLKKILQLSAILVVFFTGNLLKSSELDYNNSSTWDSEDKVYLDSDQVICTDKGIFVLMQSNEGYLVKLQMPQLNADSDGLFVLAKDFPAPVALERCPKGHIASCPRCMSCRVKDCPYRCRCKR